MLSTTYSVVCTFTCPYLLTFTYCYDLYWKLMKFAVFTPKRNLCNLYFYLPLYAYFLTIFQDMHIQIGIVCSFTFFHLLPSPKVIKDKGNNMHKHVCSFSYLLTLIYCLWLGVQMSVVCSYTCSNMLTCWIILGYAGQKQHSL